MKTAPQYLLAGFLSLSYIVAACKKDNVSPSELDFDIQNAKDYYIYIKSTSALQGVQHALLDFKAGNELGLYTTQYEYGMLYTLVDKNTISAADGALTVKVERGKVVSVTRANMTIDAIVVVKKSDVVSPVGRIFSGSYLRSDGTILHQNFFYRFVEDNKYEAGFTYNNTLRTETYQPIGNIGAWVIRVSDNSSHRELLLFINGELKVTYMENDRKFHHGSFSEAPR